MYRTLKTYYFFFVLIFALNSSGCRNKNEIPDMRPSYYPTDKKPMGGFLAFHLLLQQFNYNTQTPTKAIKKNDNPFLYVTGTSYVVISPRINFPEKKKEPYQQNEKEIMLEYVRRGNELFLCSNSFDKDILDTLGVEIKTQYELEEAIGDFEQMKDTYSSTKGLSTEKIANPLFYYPFESKITKYDTLATTVLGTNQHGEANYIVIRYGKGKIYLHVEPAAFSNYSLLSKRNTAYFEKIFSYLQAKPPKEKKSIEYDYPVAYLSNKAYFARRDNFSALGIFWDNPPLLFALLIACALMLLYIAFGSKRQRRLVPPMPANTNATVSFVRTISSLYLQRKDNRNIAVKMITYFLDYVRNYYYLNTSNLNKEFIQSLSRKSSVSEKRVEQLIDRIIQVNELTVLTDIELFDLHNRIQEFHKRQ